MLARRAFLASLIVVAAACSTSDKRQDDSPDGGDTEGGTGGGRPSRVDGGTPQGMELPGDGEEGAPCESISDCQSDLTCIDTGRFNLGFCARGCESDNDCGREVCFSYTGLAADAHCVDLVAEEYGLCGAAVTALCRNRTCLYFPNLPVGVCVDICALEGGDEDAGTTAAPDAGSGLAMCGAEQECIDGVIASDDGEGVCGTVVGRGDACGIDIGLYCADGDICAPEDPDDLESDPRCFQDCSETGSGCESGTRCVDIRGQFAYCVPN